MVGGWCGEGALHRLGGRLAVGDPQEHADSAPYIKRRVIYYLVKGSDGLTSRY